jgi:hypothetical protein
MWLVAHASTRTLLASSRLVRGPTLSQLTRCFLWICNFFCCVVFHFPNFLPLSPWWHLLCFVSHHISRSLYIFSIWYDILHIPIEIYTMAVKLGISSLPTDIQSSVFAFLEYDELARMSAVSQQLRGVAIMDRLWSPLLARHFCEVVLPHSTMSRQAQFFFRVVTRRWLANAVSFLIATTPLRMYVFKISMAASLLESIYTLLLLEMFRGNPSFAIFCFIVGVCTQMAGEELPRTSPAVLSILSLVLFLRMVYLQEHVWHAYLNQSPAHKFRVLALQPCTICHDTFLPAMPRPAPLCYPNPHTCRPSGRMSRVACHCQCRCLRATCLRGKTTDHLSIPLYSRCPRCYCLDAYSSWLRVIIVHILATYSVLYA